MNETFLNVRGVNVRGADSSSRRGGSPSAVDRLLASRFGSRSLELVAAGAWNRVVTLRGQELTDVPLSEPASCERSSPMARSSGSRAAWTSVSGI